jgi:hypothetical protein
MDWFRAGRAIVLTLKTLFLAEYQIDFYAVSVVVVGTLVAAKVVVILDHTRLGPSFASARRPALVAIHKTIIHGAATLLLIGGERVFHAYRERGGIGTASPSFDRWIRSG